MKQELAQATQNWLLIPQEAKALIERSLTLLERKDIGNNRMSPYQLEHFVLDDEHPTDWGKYKQAIAEIESRIGILMSDHVQHRKAQAEHGKALWWVKVLHPFQWIEWVRMHRAWKMAEAQQQEVAFKMIERHIEHCLLELKTFEAKAQKYYDAVGEKEVVQLETEYWEARKVYFEQKAFEQMAKNLAQMAYAKQMIAQEMARQNGG